MDIKDYNIDKMSTLDKTNLVKNVFNEIAEKYMEIFFENTEDKKYVDKFLDSLPGKRILDAGCGIGKECKYAQEQGFDIIGIDFAEEIIKVTQKKYPNGKFEVMDINHLSFPNESFDGIIFINTLFHIPKSQIDNIFAELNRVLKPGGKMILLLQEGDEEKLVEEPLKKGSFTYMQEYTLDYIEKKLNNIGLKIYDYERETVHDKYCPLSKKLILYVTK